MLTRQDMDLFVELLEQRERLQTLIDKAAGKEFSTTVAGKKLLSEIAQQETIITNQLRQLLNHSHKQHNVAQSYDQFGAMAQPRYMDRKG